MRLISWNHSGGSETVRNSTVSIYPIDRSAFAYGILICIENR
jgi:hypothetical protein